MDEPVTGFVVPVHRALTEPILMLWIAGLILWFIGHMAAVWAAKRDPAFVDVVRRHLRIPSHLNT